ncbi:hypothetical protein [Acetobacter pasteurianus]|uniref:hypothetical protein n=1 Tax=Acetobacter TaxID=434 RepID=UPI000A6AC232|nr:hypothetical protein [Acetobacter pasteurianus]
MTTKPLYELFGYKTDFESMGQKIGSYYKYAFNVGAQAKTIEDTYEKNKNTVDYLRMYSEYFHFFNSILSILKPITNQYTALYKDFSPLEWAQFCDKVHSLEPLYNDQQYVADTQNCIKKMNAYVEGMFGNEQHNLHAEASKTWNSFKNETNKINKSIFNAGNGNK